MKKDLPPLPKKKPAAFHHPLGFELYDGLAMDMYAMTYAEPLLAENERLRAALRGLLALDEEHHQRHPGDEDVCAEVRAAREALTPNSNSTTPPVA